MRGLTRGLPDTLEQPTLGERLGDVFAVVRDRFDRARRWVRHRTCYALHGGHELYRARTDTKLYQECLLCGYETPGWTIDRRDRRLHLVTQAGRQVGRKTGTRG